MIIWWDQCVTAGMISCYCGTLACVRVGESWKQILLPFITVLLLWLKEMPLWGWSRKTFLYQELLWLNCTITIKCLFHCVPAEGEGRSFFFFNLKYTYLVLTYAPSRGLGKSGFFYYCKIQFFLSSLSLCFIKVPKYIVLWTFTNF